jgi:hypothetical protein
VYNCDPKCYELAEYFMPDAKPEDIGLLAEAIQECVEDNIGTEVNHNADSE